MTSNAKPIFFHRQSEYTKSGLTRNNCISTAKYQVCCMHYNTIILLQIHKSLKTNLYKITCASSIDEGNRLLTIEIVFDMNLIKYKKLLNQITVKEMFPPIQSTSLRRWNDIVPVGACPDINDQSSAKCQHDCVNNSQSDNKLKIIWNELNYWDQ